MKPFRFGAAVDPMSSATRWRELARRVEATGYSTLLLPDHFVVPLAPVPALATAAAVTSTLRVGAMVFANDFRHPAVLAKDAATLDVLTDGRVEVGIGAGWHKGEYEATGLPYDEPAVRVARLAESVTVLKGLWSGEPFSFEGEHYTITEMVGTPTPVQRPHPPLMIGGSGRRVLEIAAQHADVISISPHVDRAGRPLLASLSREAVAHKCAGILRMAGDREIELSIYYGTPARLTDDRRATAEQIAGEVAQRYGEPVDPAMVMDSPFYLFGTVDECIDQLVERRETIGFSYPVICGNEAIEAFAPVVAKLVGT